MGCALGHSGAKLWREGAYFHKLGSPRLMIAAAKQAGHSSRWLEAPRVQAKRSNGGAELVMEWIDGAFPLAAAGDARRATAAACGYVLESQGDGWVPVSPMIRRVRAVAGADAKLVAAIVARLEALRRLPAGRTHGDLTFCNLLVSTRAVWAIDFSDCTVDSPLLDAVKLRQDSFHGWAARLTEVDADAAAQADATLHRAFSANLKGYTAAWASVSAWSLICRVFSYGDAGTKQWAEREAWRCIRLS